MRIEPRGISSLAEGKGKKIKLGDKARAGREAEEPEGQRRPGLSTE